jgi:uncharacterized protein YdiU (UPF0061 family)
MAGMRKKIGLELEQEIDAEIIQELLDWMHDTAADFTNTFRDLSCGVPPAAPQYRDARFEAWYRRWQARLEKERRPLEARVGLMRSVNPAVIPRNHQVETALAVAQNENDLTVMQRLLDVLQRPFDLPENLEYCQPATAGKCAYRTYCGT